MTMPFTEKSVRFFAASRIEDDGWSCFETLLFSLAVSNLNFLLTFLF